MERPPLKKEKSMETTKPDTAIENDVLHLGSQSTLSAEAIAKAIAHHKRHHSGDQPQQAAAKASGGKKGKPSK
jgi:predicted nicotinamide N-methyase